MALKPSNLIYKSQSVLSGYLIAEHVDRIRSETRDGVCRLQFHFDH